MTENIFLTKQINNIATKRDINDQIILEFQLLLSHENWEEIFMEDDANISFNKFFNIQGVPGGMDKSSGECYLG